MKKTLKGDGDQYFAILCNCSSDNKPLLCGVYGSKQEAKDVAEEIKDCGAKHKIIACSVEITFTLPKPSKKK